MAEIDLAVTRPFPPVFPFPFEPDRIDLEMMNVLP